MSFSFEFAIPSLFQSYNESIKVESEEQHVVANEVLSEEGELNFNNQGSLVGTDSAAGKIIRYPFTPEKEIQQRF